MPNKDQNDHPPARGNIMPKREALLSQGKLDPQITGNYRVSIQTIVAELIKERQLHHAITFKVQTASFSFCVCVYIYIYIYVRVCVCGSLQ